jgi:hypothetical protein
LTAVQNGNLIAQIENFTAQRQTNLTTKCSISVGNTTGITGFVFGCLAAQGASANGQTFTDRRTQLRNCVQNWASIVMELHADGRFETYDYMIGAGQAMLIAYHIATGEEALAVTRFPYLINRPEVLARHLSNDGYRYYRGPSHNAFVEQGGRIFTFMPDATWVQAVVADVTRSSLSTSLVNTMWTNTPNNWTTSLITSDATWTALLCNDETLVGATPAQLGLPLNKMFNPTGWAEFRGGWNNSTDLVGQFMAGPNAQGGHDNYKINSLTIRVGSVWLIKDNYVYGGRASNWETSTPIGANEVGGYHMCKSTMGFTPATSQGPTTFREDRDGSTQLNTPSRSATDFPVTAALSAIVWAGGTCGSFSDNGVVAQVTGTATCGATGAMTQLTAWTTQFGFVPGASSTQGTYVVWDQFTAPGTIDHIRRNFCSVVKPTISGETVLQGSTTAGVLTAPAQSVVIVNGAYQVTIQCVSTLDADPAINVIGGVGFENFYDGYDGVHGANMDFVSNTQNPADPRFTTNAQWLAGQWRTSFRTRQSLAAEMIHVLTVDAAGTTAPVYDRTSALALFTLGAAPIMPGNSQYWNAKILNATTGKVALTSPTLYAAANTTLGSDNATGFVEPSGNGYARKQMGAVGADWNLATVATPATATNANDIVWPIATGNWPQLVGVSFWDALTGGNLICSDFLGSGYWIPFLVSAAASPAVLTCEGHGFTNGMTVAVTTKFSGGQALPTLSQGSWGGLLTVASVTTNTFTVTTAGAVALNASSVGSGSVKQVVPVTIASTNTFRILAGQQTIAQQ